MRNHSGGACLAWAGDRFYSRAVITHGSRHVCVITHYHTDTRDDIWGVTSLSSCCCHDPLTYVATGVLLSGLSHPDMPDASGWATYYKASAVHAQRARLASLNEQVCWREGQGMVRYEEIMIIMMSADLSAGCHHAASRANHLRHVLRRLQRFFVPRTWSIT